MWRSRALLSLGLTLVSCCFLQVPALADVILFEDGFEDDDVGTEPQKWTYDPDAEIKTIGQVGPDPLDPSNQVFTDYGGYWADNGAEYTDFVAEWDWMFAQTNARNNSLGFRVQGASAHYQLSRRGGGVDWQIYMFNGAWNAIATAFFPTEIDRWYRVQLTVMGEEFIVKVKEREDDTPFDALSPVIQVSDATYDRGKFSTSYWGPIDNVLITQPDLVVERTLPDSFAPGETFPVSLDLAAFAPFTGAVIRERIPRFWTAAGPSAPGRIETDAGGRQTLVWEIKGGVGDQSFSYNLTAPDPYANVSFVGSRVEADGRAFRITGDSRVKGGTDGFLNQGLVITLRQSPASPGCNPGESLMRQDYLTDGDALSEVTVAPEERQGVTPDFNGASPSPGQSGPSTNVWTRMGNQGLIPLDSCDLCMAYVAFYVENTTGAALPVRVGSASDDSEQILIDGREVWIHDVCRGNGRAQVQDRTPVFDLQPGKHLVLQKVFEGTGGFDSAIRFEDEDGNPLTGPVSGGPVQFSLDPAGYQVGTAFVQRDIPASLDVGESGTVCLKLRLREATAGAAIEENVPAGFAISQVSDGGTVLGQKIVWNLAGPLQSRDLCYRVAVPEGAADAAFQGTAVLGGRSSPVVGAQGFTRGIMNDAGFIKHWLVLGPLDTFGIWQGDPTNPPLNLEGPGAAPEAGDIRLDFLTDGTTTERDIRPFDGMRINPRFGGDGLTTARAQGYENAAIVRECFPRVPTWERVVLAGGTFNNNDYFGMDIDSHATYAACYLQNGTGATIQTNLAFHSDDAFIVFLNDVEVGVHEPPPCSSSACGRGYGAENTVADTFPVAIPTGESFLLTRVHDGLGGSGHRLRFQDAGGKPLLPPALTVSLRSRSEPPPVHVRRILSSDVYRRGGPPITVTLRVESAGAHRVQVREVLPLGWTAGDVSDGGVQAGGAIDWDLAAVAGARDLTYRLVTGDCPGDGGWCGNGDAGSTYTVDGDKIHSLNGDASFRRDTRGTDPLSPWEVLDLAASGGGTQRVGPQAVDVTGKGGGVKQSRDEFRFVSIPAGGDFEIAARIDCLDDPGGSGMGGLMVRETSDTFSAHAYFALSSTAPVGGGAGTLRGFFRRQTKANQPTSTILIGAKDVIALPVWIKLARSGTKVSLHRSADGASYTEVASREIGTGASQINLPADVRVGLAVTGGGSGSTRTDYREVTGTVNGAPLPQFELAPNPPRDLRGTAGDGRVDLAWDEPAPGGPAWSGYAVLRDGTKVADLPSSQRTYSEAGLTNGTTYCYLVRSTAGAVQGQASNVVCLKPERIGATFRRGDVDANGRVEITDPVALLGFLFLGQGKPACLDAGDTDDDGRADISDAVASLGYQYLGGPAPAAPGPAACGSDVNQESPDLGCEDACP